jgi:ATP-binding cassette, subfamily B, bacterial MsbA
LVARKKRGRYSGEERIRGELGQKEALRRLWHWLLPLRVPILIGLLFTVLWSAINLSYAALAKEFLNTIDLGVKQQSSKPDLLAAQQTMRLLNQYTALGFFLCIVRGFLYFGMNYTWQYASQKLTLRLRNEVFRHLQTMSLSFFDHRKTGQLLACLSNDVAAVTSVLDAIQDVISAPVILIGGTTLLFFVNWKLALISVLCLPPIAWVITRAVRKMEKYAEQLQDGRARVVDLAEEALSGVRVIKSFGNEEYEVERFNRRSDDVFRSVLRTTRVRIAMRPVIEGIGFLAILMVLWVAGQQAIQATVHAGKPASIAGDLAFFVLVLQQVAAAARDAGSIGVNLTQAGVAADRVFTLLDIQSDIQDKPEAIELNRVEGRVAFEHVDFAYASGIPVLKNISFVMEPGEVVALVGPTGSGKTTIAALIPRFYDVLSGSISVDGVDVRDATLKSLRNQIGIVPQDTNLFAGSIRDNIAYGRLDATDEEIEAAAKMANAWEFIERFPEGLQTRVGERGVTLSGGQRQRVAIARAVLRNPRILILDEATSSLDTQSEALVQDALQKIMRHRTTLVIAHRLSTIRNADKILVMKEGQIVESGRHEELLGHNGIYSQLYRTQFRWEGDGARGPLE